MSGVQTGEIMFGFMIDKLDQSGNKKLKKNLEKTLLKKVTRYFKTVNVGEFYSFIIGTCMFNDQDLRDSDKRIATEEKIHELYHGYEKS